MPCDKSSEGLEGIGFWDFLMGNSSLEEVSLQEFVNSGSSIASNVWYYYGVDLVTRDVQYQFPPSDKWVNSS